MGNCCRCSKILDILESPFGSRKIPLEEPTSLDEFQRSLGEKKKRSL